MPAGNRAPGGSGHGTGSLQVAATYMGTVVGAGFASGQEAMRFFVAHGRPGLWGMVLTVVVLGTAGALALDLGYRLRLRSAAQLLTLVCGPQLGMLADLALNAMLFGGVVVMLAGSGALASEQWGLPPWFGVAVTALLTVATLWGGLRRLMQTNAVVVPLMVTGAGGLALLTLLQPATAAPAPAALPDLAASSHWALSAALFAGYNLLTALGVLVPVGAAVPSRRDLLLGGIGGALGLGALLAVMGLALWRTLPGSALYEVPMLYVARPGGWWAAGAYGVILWAEVYTTAVAGAFALARRIAEGTGRPERFRLAAAAVVLVACAGTRFGFGDLMGVLYPAFGYVGAVIMAMVVVTALPLRRNPV